MKLSELVDAEIVNDHVNVHVKNLEIEGQLTSNIMGLITDPYSTRVFRVLDVKRANGNNLIVCKLEDQSIYIALSRIEYKLVEKLYRQIGKSL